VDTDGDGACNAGSDGDDDADGVADAMDNCPLVSNASQTNTDGTADGGDACDLDDDNDQQTDVHEIACASDPLSAASKSPDLDGDHTPDCVDTDDDNDGTSDADEEAGGSDPSDPTSAPEVCDGADNDGDGATDEGFTDTDGDGQADCVDTDDDNDGTSDTDEQACGSDPLSGSSTCPSYVFTGFSAPVDNAPVLNVANAGRTVPIKYRLTTPSGEPVSDPASFSKITSAKAPCGALDDAGTDTLETYSGSSGVQYLGDGHWQINWATSKSYSSTTSGPCRVLTLELSDGATHHANFRFK
jgi:hypothetical protein